MSKKQQGMDEFLYIGNAEDDQREGSHRGWFVGHFVDPGQALRHTTDVEVKWGVHPRDDEKGRCAANSRSTTLTILISGRFALDFPGLSRSVVLGRPGDYALFAPQTAHSWRALEDSVVLTVRWPSINGDQQSVSNGTS